MKTDDVVAKILSDNDQYAAEAREWARESDFTNLMNFWAWLQEDHKDIRVELATRLASVTLAPLLAEVWAEKREGKQ